MRYWEKFIQTLGVGLLIVVSYGILGPLEIYFGNIKEFSFSVPDFIWYMIGISIFVLVIVSAIVSLLPEKVFQISNALLLGIGVSSYVQSMFMNIKLSEENGAPMQWSTLGNFPIINLLIWLFIIGGVIAICVFMKKRWKKVSLGIAAFLSAIQLVAVGSLLLSPHDLGAVESELRLSGNEQYCVANEDNIIVFVLDTFGNTQLENTLKEFPDALDSFNDFTFYNNADCHYYCTFPSMTHTLTGMEFDFEAKSQDWMEQAWSSERTEKFYNNLKKKGYICNLFSNDIGYVYGDIENLNGKFDNVHSIDQRVDNVELVKLLGKVSIYRNVPYVIKPYFEVLTQEFRKVVSYVDAEEPIDDNAEFYRRLMEKGVSTEKDVEKALIIQHLFGTHQPYTLDQNANEVEEATQVQTAAGLLRIVTEYLAQLKELGVYDDAVIIITADHGAWYAGDTQPIFFIKQKGEKHKQLEENSSPISLDDFQATIMELIGEDCDEFGTSIFDWNEEDERLRTVYMRMNDDNYPTVQGSAFNVYYGYSYKTDKNELNKNVEDGPDEILGATPW